MYKGNSLDPDETNVPALGQNDSETLHQFLSALGNAIDAKHPSTRSHSQEVARLAEAIGWAMGLSGQEVRWLNIAGHLHDIGKIGIPDSVLSKSGALSEAEWEVIYSHPTKGDEIVRPVAEFAKPGSVADIVLCHHERWDGGGYPGGLKETDIPLGARIMAVADTLSTMMQARTYKPARTFEEAVNEIVRCAGTAYDPDVVDAFLAVRDDIKHVLCDGE